MTDRRHDIIAGLSLAELLKFRGDLRSLADCLPHHFLCLRLPTLWDGFVYKGCVPSNNTFLQLNYWGIELYYLLDKRFIQKAKCPDVCFINICGPIPLFRFDNIKCRALFFKFSPFVKQVLGITRVLFDLFTQGGRQGAGFLIAQVFVAIARLLEVPRGDGGEAPQAYDRAEAGLPGDQILIEPVVEERRAVGESDRECGVRDREFGGGDRETGGEALGWDHARDGRAKRAGAQPRAVTSPYLRVR